MLVGKDIHNPKWKFWGVTSTRGARGSKRISLGPEQEQSARMTKQRTRELTSTEECLLDTTTSNKKHCLHKLMNRNRCAMKARKTLLLCLRNMFHASMVAYDVHEP